MFFEFGVLHCCSPPITSRTMRHKTGHVSYPPICFFSLAQSSRSVKRKTCRSFLAPSTSSTMKLSLSSCLFCGNNRQPMPGSVTQSFSCKNWEYNAMGKTHCGCDVRDEAFSRFTVANLFYTVDTEFTQPLCWGAASKSFIPPPLLPNSQSCSNSVKSEGEKAKPSNKNVRSCATY